MYESHESRVAVTVRNITPFSGLNSVGLDGRRAAPLVYVDVVLGDLAGEFAAAGGMGGAAKPFLMALTSATHAGYAVAALPFLVVVLSTPVAEEASTAGVFEPWVFDILKALADVFGGECVGGHRIV